MKWIKASERLPVALKDRQRINIKYKGAADSLISISGRWYWNNDVPTDYLVSTDSWSGIEWLDESTPPVSATELTERDSERAAIYLEECHISGDTIVRMDHSLDDVPEYKRGSFYLHDLLAAYANAQPVSAMDDGWVKVEDALPKVHKVAKYSNRVLCLTNTGKTEVGYFSDNLWCRDNGHYFSGHGYTITHWRPLPPPPSK